ncbi:cytochrome b [Luteimonas lutimaris]|uniref:Cytochrome b n=1 Tax=Luteimonas lutimaris TaxID=698645 RepID=A0ABP7MNY5_9GAMM|nr:cytochrome b/b6 domain-containing protein [Luteimonas sp.]
MSTQTPPFHARARLLHWLMAPLVVAMLFIGIGMLSTTSSAYALLLAIHKPLGAAILVLVLLRIYTRLRHRPPPLPADLPPLQRRAATLSHWLLYALMLLMPLSGWAMLSAAGYPVTLSAGIHLPPILPRDAALFAVLRGAHHWLALLLFATFLLHLAAALFHGLIRRDGVLASMGPWPLRGRR